MLVYPTMAIHLYTAKNHHCSTSTNPKLATRNPKPMNIDKIGSAFLRQILLRMKVSRPYITKVLHEDVNFSFRTAAKLANALKMDFFRALRPQEDGGNVSENSDVG